MQLTLYTDYSLRVLVYLSANQDKTVTITEISDYYRISRNHLVKVVHNLSTLGYIQSFRGKGGGLKLAHPPEKISVGEVVRKVEPNFNIVECFSQGSHPPCTIVSVCSLKNVLYQASQRFLEELDAYTLDQAVVKNASGELPMPFHQMAGEKK